MKVFDVREIFTDEIVARKGKTIDTNSGFNSENSLGINEFENYYDNVNLDPVLNVSYFLDDIETINQISDDLTFSKAGKEKLKILKKANANEFDDSNKLKSITYHIGRNLSDRNPDLSKQYGPTKAKLIRDGKAINIQGGLDFSNAIFDEKIGKRCIVKQEEIETIERSPILECKHR